MPAIHAARRAALRTQLSERELDGLLVTNLLNVRYLTGFTGSNAALIVLTDSNGSDEAGTVLCTDGRYLTQSAAQTPDLRRLIERASAPALIDIAAPGAWGFESTHVTVDDFDRLARRAQQRQLTLVPVAGLVETLRAVKDAGEIQSLRQACAIGDAAFAELLDSGAISVGRTEREIGLDLDHRMRRLGAEDVAFETIVAAGPNSAIPHHRPTDAELRTGDFVKFDFGARYQGYHSDMTRTVVLGGPADWQREVYDLVRSAQQAACDLARAGAHCADVDAAARSVIDAGGHRERFPHGLGHGVGLEIHEAPALASTSTGSMSLDMVLTIEPGVYLEGRGGVRIEDSGVVRASDYEVLTVTTKDLLVL